MNRIILWRCKKIYVLFSRITTITKSRILLKRWNFSNSQVTAFLHLHIHSISSHFLIKKIYKSFLVPFINILPNRMRASIILLRQQPGVRQCHSVSFVLVISVTSCLQKSPPLQSRLRNLHISHLLKPSKSAWSCQCFLIMARVKWTQQTMLWSFLKHSILIGSLWYC